MIYLDNVTYRYAKKSKQDALSKINARVGSGLHRLIGANGAGKTTLLNIIGSSLFPTEGTCEVCNTDTRLRLPSELCRVSMMSTGMRMPAKNIESMVKIHACFFPTFSAELLQKYLEKFGIEATEPFSHMSLGTLNKSNIAYVLALQTPVTLLDEPANGLDIDSKQIFQQIMADNMNGTNCCIVSTHTVADLQNIYDGVIMVDGGELIINTSIDDLLQRIAFVSSTVPPFDALGYHTVAGRTISIVPADSPALDSCAETEVDYALLYMALRDKNNIQLKSLIQQ